MKTRLLVFAIILGFISINRAFGATRTWKGSTNFGDWNTSGNWVEGAVPTTSDDVVIGNGQSFTWSPVVNFITGDAVCKSLNVSSSTAVTIYLLGADLTVSNTIVFGKNDVTISGNGLFTGNSTLTIGVSGSTTTYQFDANANIAGLVTVNNGSTSTIDITSGNTLSLAAAFKVGSFSTTSLTTSGSGTMSVSGASSLNQVSTLTNTCSNFNFNSLSSLTFANSTSLTNSGKITATSCTFSMSGNSNFISNSGTFTCSGGALTLSSGSSNGYITNTGTFNITSCPVTLANTNEYLSNSGSGVFRASSSTFTASGSGAYITNSATFSATACSFTFTNGGYLKNLGSSAAFTTQSGCTFDVSSSNAFISNTGVFKDHKSTFTLSGQNANIQNTGTAANFSGRGSTFNITANSGILNNDNVFTADSLSSISLTGFGSSVTNTGIFNAGTSGSACTITINAQSVNVKNTGAVGKIAYFNLGSSSIINILGTTNSYVTNTNTYSVFTLLSDASSSATIGTITSSGTPTNGYVGQFNVQRFLTGGGVSTTRGYRLLSSPVNSTAQYSSGVSPTVEANTNVLTLQNLNQSFTIYKNDYATPVSFTGAATGGSGGSTSGFTININNPSMYFYKEYLPVSNKTYTSGKHVGVTAIAGTGVATIEGTTINPTSTIPVGNGYLLYFIGPGTRTNGSTSIAPADAVVTNVGFINQGQLQVNLFYTPYNGASAYTAAAGAGKLSYNSNLTAAQGGAGFNMVGNPYASTINLAKVLMDNTASIDAIYLTSLTSYIVYSANGTSAPASGFAVSGEGFLVHSKAAGGTLIFQESEKAPTQQLTGPALLMGKPKEDQPLTGLYMKLEQDSSNYEYCGIYFRNDWSDKFESGDALYLRGAGNVAMSSLTSNGIKAAVNHMSNYLKGSRVKLSTEATASGIYKLKIEDIRNIDPIFDIYLVDHYSKDSLDIRRYGSYSFNINTSDSTTFGANRFELVIRRKPLPPYTLNSFTGQKVTGNIKLTWNTSNEGNYTGFVLEKLDNTTGQFNQLYSMQGNGSGSYSYTDPEPNGLITNTYRLKQTNIDDQISYSDNVNVNFDINGMINKNVSVYPNPAKASIRVNIENGNISAPSGAYSTIIYNASGVAVSRKSESSSTWTQDISNWGPGSYVIQIKDSKGKVTGQAKFTKVQ